LAANASSCVRAVARPSPIKENSCPDHPTTSRKRSVAKMRKSAATKKSNSARRSVRTATHPSIHRLI